MAAVIETFLVFLRLGLTAFGGPVAHLAYFRDTFVVRRGWLDDARFAEIVALSQFLPGPASSQTGMAIGMLRAGWPGLLAAWLAFTAPSALLLFGFAALVRHDLAALGSGWLAGVKAAVVAVVAHALAGMARQLLRGGGQWAIAAGAASLVLAIGGSASQLAVIALSALAGLLLPTTPGGASAMPAPAPRSRRGAALCLGAFALLLAGLPLAAWLSGDDTLALADRFYRTGALVFGGGHVVLPLLHGAVVETGLVDESAFLAGYGAAQAVPGPLFTFSAYLGAVIGDGSAFSALLALLAIFLPSMLLIGGLLPHWERLRGLPRMQRAVNGVNAGVIGLLAAVLWDPVLVTGIRGPASAAIALGALALLVGGRAPSWAVVLGAAGAGALLL